MITGIGGQGVQLAATTLATAAVAEGREAMVFGVYGGSMRGGNTDATVVLADGPLYTPPTVGQTWSAIVMHHDYWPQLRDRLRPGALVVVDSSVFQGCLGVAAGTNVVAVEASTTAIGVGNALGGSMVAIGAYAAATGIVGLDALEAAAQEVLPPYRQRHAELNIEALRAGHALVSGVVSPAWAAADERVGR
jgi:Pyruvate/2-oxoacid:ferredoxin oxidoreductase gamma subunit